MNDPTPKHAFDGLFKKHGPALALVMALTIPMALGWAMLSERLSSRTLAAAEEASEVSRIWGGPLRQGQPVVKWRRVDAATPDLSEGEIRKTDVQVTLGVEYRRRGATEYPCYDANVVGAWDFANPSTSPAFVAFSLPLPTRGDALMLRDLKLLVDGEEDASATEYSPDRIVWTGQVKAGATARFQVAYAARGMDQFGYVLSRDDGRPVTDFRLAMVVRGARGELDFPVGSMSPTYDERSGTDRRMVWQVNRLLSSFDIGIVLPDDRPVVLAISKLTRNAPLFFLMFAFVLLFVLRKSSLPVRALHLMALAAGYFMCFPLGAYLTAYMPWQLAVALSVGTVAALSLGYALRFVGRAESAGIGLDVVFFLAVPSAAYLVPAHTGLILVVSGVIVVGIAMQVLGGLSRRIADASRPVQLEAPRVEVAPTVAQVQP